MKNIFLSIIIGFCLLFAIDTSGQVNLKKTGAQAPPTSVLSTADRDAVFSTAEKLLNEYAEAMTLIDKSSGIITPNSANEFRKLFGSNAQIDKDYEEFLKGERQSPRSYADAVFNRFSQSRYKGFQVKIADASVKEVINDPVGFWVVVIQVEKIRSTYATSDNRVGFNPGGETMYQEIRMDIPKDNLNNGNIAKISKTNANGSIWVIAIPDEYYQYAGPSLSAFLPLTNVTNSTFWNAWHSESTFESKGQLSFSIGADFMTNRFLPKASPSKNLFLTGGIYYSVYRINSEVGDFSIRQGIPSTAVDFDGDFINYMGLVNNINVSENLSVGLLSIPLGVGYRIMKTQKSALLLQAKVVPGIVFSLSGEVSGFGTYDAYLPEAMWRLLEEGAADLRFIDDVESYGPFEAGEDKAISSDANVNTKGFVLGFQFSPVYYFDLSEYDSSWSLMVGLDLNIQPGSFIQHDDLDDDLFKRANDDYTSILQHYGSDLSTIGLGFKIGLHHRLRTQP